MVSDRRRADRPGERCTSPGGLRTAASRAASAAEEQTKIQRQLQKDAAQPYVWVDIRPDESQGTFLNLVVGNSGPTVAEKVQVKVDPNLPSTADRREGANAAQELLSDGIESLPPGGTLMWPLGKASKVVDESGQQAYKFTVTAKGPFGPVPALTSSTQPIGGARLTCPQEVFTS